MCKDIKEKLKKYGDELGLDYQFTIDSLINSHRHLRSLNLELNSQRIKVLNEAREIGIQEGKEHALTHNYISVASLKRMSIKQFVELLSEGE